MLIVQAFANLILWFNNSNYVTFFPYFIFLALSLRFLWGPLLFLFVKTSVGNLPKNYFIHFIPFLIILPILTFQTFSYSESELQAMVIQKSEIFAKYKLFNFAIYFQNVFYILLGIFIIFKYQTEVLRQYSNIELLKIKWLFNVLILLALMHFLIPILFIYLHLNYFKNLYLIQLPVLGYVAWKTWKQPAVFENFAIINYERNSSSTITNLDEKKLAIENTIKKNRPYLNTELTIKDLADLVELPPYQVSELLNKGFGKNFYDFVNYYRIEEAKKQLLNPKNANLTLEGIGLNCGFKSKSTFFAVFKKMTGKTPSEFRNS